MFDMKEERATPTDWDTSKIDLQEILKRVAAECAGEYSAEIVLSLKPVTDRPWIERQHGLIGRLRLFLEKDNTLNLQGVYWFEDDIKTAERVTSLDALVLHNLARAVATYHGLQAALKKETELSTLFTIKRMEESPVDRILKVITPDGTVESSASSDLKSIRRKMESIESRMRESTQRSFKDLAGKGYLADDTIAMRGGYSCLAVKPSAKNRVDGVIIDTSATGQTVYVVPNRVLSLQNDLFVARDEERREILRILSEFTAWVNENGNDLKQVNRELTDFDILHAITRHSIRNNWFSPESGDSQEITIYSGRHPLLGEAAVPLEFSLGTDRHILIITGPNTGGKTVVLKTIGLFITLHQCGIPIPASSGSRLGIFDGLFIDIGDDQSISQSLSTFSAHLSRLKNILDRAGSRSCVLVDEIGAGTDPTEGAALAVSIIHELRNRGVFSVFTTHYLQVKQFAADSIDVENASMEFNTESLEPTYRLLMGIPGSSRALDICTRLGLPDDIISRARKNLDESYVKLETLLQQVEETRGEQEEQRLALEQRNRQLEEREKELAVQGIELQKQLADIRKREKESESRFLKESRKTFEKLVRDIRSGSDIQQGIQDGQQLFREIQEHGNTPDDEPAVEKAEKIDYKPGDRVKIVSKDVKGTILSSTNKPGKYVVQAGIVKVTIDESDLRLIQEEIPLKKKASVSFKRKGFYDTLDLRGARYEEALDRLERFIDSAIAEKVKTVRVIHGTGTGALRTGIQRYCRDSSYVKSFDFEKAPDSQGKNFGVTVLVLI
jgi:DNA mismatch repair protein MutS2